MPRRGLTLSATLLAWLVLPWPAAGAAEPNRGAPWREALDHYERGDYAAARAGFRRLSGGEDPELDFYLGRLALWFDDGPEALERLGRAVQLRPDSARVQNAWGDACGLAAQTSGLLAKPRWALRCVQAYQRAAALEPDNPHWRWSLLGYYCLAPRLVGGGMERARAEADTLRRLDPAEGRIAHATLWLSAGQAAKAFAEFDAVLAENPDDFLALYHVGRCAAVSGQQVERGVAALRRCLQLEPPTGEGRPRLASVHHRLGELLARQGDAAAATRAQAEALRLQPDFRAAKVALRQ
jgi:predicted Zn-dependent protease